MASGNKFDKGTWGNFIYELFDQTHNNEEDKSWKGKHIFDYRNPKEILAREPSLLPIIDRTLHKNNDGTFSCYAPILRHKALIHHIIEEFDNRGLNNVALNDYKGHTVIYRQNGRYTKNWCSYYLAIDHDAHMRCDTLKKLKNDVQVNGETSEYNWIEDDNISYLWGLEAQFKIKDKDNKERSFMWSLLWGNKISSILEGNEQNSLRYVLLEKNGSYLTLQVKEEDLDTIMKFLTGEGWEEKRMDLFGKFKEIISQKLSDHEEKIKMWGYSESDPKEGMQDLIDEKNIDMTDDDYSWLSVYGYSWLSCGIEVELIDEGEKALLCMCCGSTNNPSLEFGLRRHPEKTEINNDSDRWWWWDSCTSFPLRDIGRGENPDINGIVEKLIKLTETYNCKIL